MQFRIAPERASTGCHAKTSLMILKPNGLSLFSCDSLYLVSTRLGKIFWVMTDDPTLLAFAKAARGHGVLRKKTVEEALITVRIVKSLG